MVSIKIAIHLPPMQDRSEVSTVTTHKERHWEEQILDGFMSFSCGKRLVLCYSQAQLQAGLRGFSFACCRDGDSGISAQDKFETASDMKLVHKATWTLLFCFTIASFLFTFKSAWIKLKGNTFVVRSMGLMAFPSALVRLCQMKKPLECNYKGVSVRRTIWNSS